MTEQSFDKDYYFDANAQQQAFDHTLQDMQDMWGTANYRLNRENIAFIIERQNDQFQEHVQESEDVVLFDKSQESD